MKRHAGFLLAGLCSFALTTGAACAADAPAAPSPAATSEGVGDIIVTAQKKEERLQSVPLSVTAFSAGAVRDLHAATLQALQGSVTNVSLGVFSNTPNNAVITIRGIGIIEPDPYAGNTVGIVVDGVPQFFSMGALADIYDVDRIEILRGPQGTLFGANTTGGVINVVNAQPVDRFQGKVNLTYGNYNHINFGAVVNTPVARDLDLRLSVSHDQRDGFIQNVAGGPNLGRRNVTQFRGALKYAPSSNFDVTWSNEYDVGRNGAPVVVAGDLPGEAEYVAPGVQNMYVSPCAVAGAPCVAPKVYKAALAGVPDSSNIDTVRTALTINLRQTAIGNITAITAYKDTHLTEWTDQDGTPVFEDDTRRHTSEWQFSQELRDQVNLLPNFEVMAGGFFLTDAYKHEQDFRIQFAAPGLLQINLQDQKNYSLSGFAQSYLKLFDNRLRLSAGVRVTNEHTHMIASTATSIALSGMTTFDGTDANTGVADTALGTVAGNGARSWTNVGWKLGADFKVTRDVLLYGSWARGFKSGGFVGRIGLPSDIGPYAPEKVDTFEAGIKSEFLDHKVRFNLTGFTTSYRNMQLAEIYFSGSGANIVQGNTIINAASSRIKGIESELTIAPMPGLTVSGSLAYLSAKYTNFLYPTGPGTFINMTGKPLQNAPSWSGSVYAEYQCALTDSISARAKVQYNYTGQKYLVSILDTPRASVQAQHIVNANFDVMLPHDIQVGVYATNLLNKHYIESVYDAPGTLGLTNYSSPQQYGVTASIKF